jgi:hypothetical protein
MRFDPSKVLLDPYGRSVVVPKNYRRDAAGMKGDNAATAMKSVVVDPQAYDWEGDTPCGDESSETDKANQWHHSKTTTTSFSPPQTCANPGVERAACLGSFPGKSRIVSSHPLAPGSVDHGTAARPLENYILRAAPNCLIGSGSEKALF